MEKLRIDSKSFLPNTNNWGEVILSKRICIVWHKKITSSDYFSENEGKRSEDTTQFLVPLARSKQNDFATQQISMKCFYQTNRFWGKPSRFVSAKG